MVNKVLYAIAFIALLLSGCTEDLTERPASIISPDNFYKTNADFEAAITGIHRSYFVGSGGAWSVFDNYIAIYLCAGAEDANGKGDNRFNRLDVDPNSEQVLTAWRNIYEAINEANMILARLPMADQVNDSDKKKYEGQARYLRALGYFYLVRWFGEIPLVTEKNMDNVVDAGQATIAETYGLIIEDLTFAKNNLPASSVKIRPTKGAAAIMLASVYLNMAGWPLKDASKYALARDEAQAVANMNVYALEKNYEDLWKVSNKLTSSEIIFMFNGVIGAGSNFDRCVRPGEEGGWEDMFSEARYFNAFPEGPRKEFTFHTDFFDAAHTNWASSGVKQPFMWKFRDAGSKGDATSLAKSGTAEGFFPIARYAEALLIFAEADARASGQVSAEALEAVNKVRRRASGYDSNIYPDLQPDISADDFLKAVVDERFWEFGFELIRWFDLLRLEMVEEVNKGLYPHVSKKNYLLPKPQSEVQMINGLQQNSGY
ncbi:MAG: RagB/SusD family nutrient uptake outer membrane protein [Tannerellaceae bacterium]|jgi:hypothetical protein|nr:RagB/SusD family nutrient uptake outer membrane protein [Tannerellaceae bacterium]